jgi:predicted regulator of Ras-like GTPase activity (Roadblock/LC7/MglB family)
LARKKKSVQEAEVVASDEPVAVDEPVSAQNLRANLQELNKYEGVIGYILRNSTSATIDLKDPAKLIDYAILSSSAFDLSSEFSQLFDLGEIENIFLEGKNVKVFSLIASGNKISVFMEKNADCEKVLERLHSV